MITALRTAALAACLALAAPVAEAATLIYAGESSAGAEGAKSPTGTLVFEFQVAESLDIASFAVSATGTNSGADLAAIRFDYEGTTGNTIAALGGFSTTAFGGASVAAYGPYDVGDMITFRFYGTTKNIVRFTISFDTLPVNSVPLPAAGGMLAFALLGGAALSARPRRN